MNIEKSLPIRVLKQKYCNSLLLEFYQEYTRFTCVDEKGGTNSHSISSTHKHIFLHLCSRVITYLSFRFFLLSCQYIQRLFSQSFNSIPLSRKTLRIENGIENKVEVFELKTIENGE